jgi:hypothetical protein
MPRVSKAKAKATKLRLARDAKQTGKLVGAFSTQDAAGYVRRLIVDEGGRLERADNGMTPPQRSIVLGRMAKLVTQLGEITGETLAVDEKRFLKSPSGVRLSDAFVEALRKHPEALLDVAEVFERFE